MFEKKVLDAVLIHFTTIASFSDVIRKVYSYCEKDVGRTVRAYHVYRVFYLAPYARSLAKPKMDCAEMSFIYVWKGTIFWSCKARRRLTPSRRPQGNKGFTVFEMARNINRSYTSWHFRLFWLELLNTCLGLVSEETGTKRKCNTQKWS